MVDPKPLRCAIYTRKSSEEGLEQDFNSLEAQREAGEAYIKSQAHEGWKLIPDHFDDGGYSGGNMDRPALQRLMDKVRAGEVDVIVIYKIDRLTRSLMDFAKLAEEFDRHGVSFVSVTQQFNTTTSMGRLMLNVLLSFAQFEREVTGERIRDKFAASKRRGMWMGGPVPLGYDVKDRGLVINEQEAETVRRIFDSYLELGNVRELAEELTRLDLRTKRVVTKTGRVMGDQNFTRGHLYKVLSNPLYVGDISHKGVRHKGLHEPIIETVTWDKVQAMLGDNTRGDGRRRKNVKEPSLLAGLLVDEFGNKLTATHSVKDGKRYRYYASRKSAARRSHNQPVGDYRISATEIEPIVIREIAGFLRDARRVTDALQLDAAEPHVIEQEIASAKALADELRSALPARQREMLAALLRRVTLTTDTVRIELNPAAIYPAAGEEESIPLDVAVSIARRGVESRLVVETTGDASRESNDSLVRAVSCGRAWLEELASGKTSSFTEIAERVGVSDRYVSRIVDLAFLAPDLVETILAGEQRASVTVKGLTVDRSVPARWVDQRQLLLN
jgi:DNA invertase Pin-like site-specific DNA recombinase